MPEKSHRAWKKKTESECKHVSPKDDEDALIHELDSCRRAFEHGNLGAILEALILCAGPDKSRFPGQWAKGSRPLPEWLNLALVDFVKDRLRRRSRGRSWLDQYDQDMIDFARYNSVLEVRDHGIRWEDAYDIASELLSGSRAEGAPETIRESYRRVTNRSKTAPLRYKTLHTIPFDLKEPNLHPMVSKRLWKRINNLRTDL
jgi:hypothetical protein